MYIAFLILALADAIYVILDCQKKNDVNRTLRKLSDEFLIFYKEHRCGTAGKDLKFVAEQIVGEMIERSNCIVFVTDSVHRTLVDVKNIKGSTTLSKYEIALRDNEQFRRPRRRIQRILNDSRTLGCNAYVILLANGYLAAEFLQYTERYQQLLRSKLMPVAGVVLHQGQRSVTCDLHDSLTKVAELNWEIIKHSSYSIDLAPLDYHLYLGLQNYLNKTKLKATKKATTLLKYSSAQILTDILVLGERLINTRGLFLLLYDSRLLQPNLHYLWNRIINVVFIRQYNAYKTRSGEKAIRERIDLDTIYFPTHRRIPTVTKYIDTWYEGKLHYGTNLFAEKITNLQKQHLRIAVFEHIPAVTEKSREYYNREPNSSTDALGIEFELIQIISKAMNFKPKFYMPHNIASEKWGSEWKNETHTGLVNEAIQGKAAFYLGDLHYTLRHLNYFDLTIPYNTECLTFLTPESLTENSWKLLILPFKLYTWIALIFTLILGSVIFYFLSLSYKKHISFYKSRIHLQTSTMKREIKGLYLFTEIENSILYTYSMLFQVSLPNLPNPWAVRVLIGWWWIYSILVAVAYRASMTATLANPVARVTIDTLTQLVKSSVQVGGWNVQDKDFFLMSSDISSQEIGNKYQLIQHEEEAIEKVANGSFCYYENSYLLKHARVKRQILEKEQKENGTVENVSLKHNLHIMEECVINMPIAIGMEKNSPLKPYVDILIRRIIEIGLVEKWLGDVMEWSKITEIQQETESEKALVNLRKLQGAFIAIAVGYVLAFTVLVGEILYWKHIVLKNPKFDKYHLDKFYDNTSNPKTYINNLLP